MSESPTPSLFTHRRIVSTTFAEGESYENLSMSEIRERTKVTYERIFADVTKAKPEAEDVWFGQWLNVDVFTANAKLNYYFYYKNKHERNSIEDFPEFQQEGKFQVIICSLPDNSDRVNLRFIRID